MIPLLGFGIGLLCLGLYWHLYNDVITINLNRYILTDYTAFGVHYTHDKYYDFMQMIWSIMPWLFTGAGVVLLIAAGVSGKSEEGTPE